MLLSLNETLVILALSISAMGAIMSIIMLGFLLRQSRQATATTSQKSSGLYATAQMMVNTLSFDDMIKQDLSDNQLLEPVTWTYIPPSEIIPGPTVMPLYPQDSLLHADEIARRHPTAIKPGFTDKLAG